MTRRLAVAGRWLLTLLLIGVIAPTVSADDAAAKRRTVLDHLRRAELEAAAVLLDDYVEQVPDDGVMLYNAACVQCRLGAIERAEGYLLGAVQAGYINFSQMRRDPDLDGIRQRATYRALLAARDAADPILADRRVEQWREAHGEDRYRFGVDTERHINFAVGSALSLAQVQEVTARQVDHLRTSLFTDPHRHSFLVAIPDAVAGVDIFDDPHIRGSYKHVSRMLIATDVGRSLRHELTHALHHAQMDELGQSHPMWIQEGLACFMEGQIAGPGPGAAVTPWTTEREAIAMTLDARDELVPWTTLFALTPSEFRRRPAAYYAQAHSIMLYLHERDRLSAWYEHYTTHFDADGSGAHAIEVVENRPLAVIEDEWRAWLRSRQVGPAQPDVAAKRAAPPPVEYSGPFCGPPAPAVVAHDFLELGRDLYAAGRYDAAVQQLQECIALHPTLAEAHYTLGLAHIRLRNRAAARHQLAILVDLDASLASLLGNLVASRSVQAKSGT